MPFATAAFLLTLKRVPWRSLDSTRYGVSPHQKRSDLSESAPSEASAIILYDGVCNLCNASVRFVLARDHNDFFRFASLQSQAGRKLARRAIKSKT
jgi:hypothetical protein